MALTADQRARLFGQIRDYLPPVDSRSLPNGEDLATFLAELYADLAAVESGTVVVLNGTASITVEIEGGQDKPVVAVLGETDGTAGLHVLKCTWALDVLTITLSGNTDGDRDVFYIVDGR